MGAEGGSTGVTVGWDAVVDAGGTVVVEGGAVAVAGGAVPVAGEALPLDGRMVPVAGGAVPVPVGRGPVVAGGVLVVPGLVPRAPAGGVMGESLVLLQSSDLKMLSLSLSAGGSVSTRSSSVTALL